MKRYILKNQHLAGVVYKTNNIIVQLIQKGTTNGRCYIIGNGHSLSVDDNNKIKKHDPFMSHFRPQISKEHTVYAFYFTFECDGLEISSYEISEFVNEQYEVYEKIILVGHSKCGVCLTNASYFCLPPINLVTISTPFYGTFIVEKKLVKARLKNKLYFAIYNKIFSDHKVDRDIATNSEFLEIMTKPVCAKHINIVSCFRVISDCKNLTDLALYMTNKVMNLKGDGVVPIASQIYNTNCKEIGLFCSHASSLKYGLKIVEYENF